MGEWVVPVELETGVPLAIALSEEWLPPVGMTGLGADWHHLAYPKSREELKSPSGLAVRQAAGMEWVDIRDHRSHHHYFDQYMTEEWSFPKTVQERFGFVTLMAAGYLPSLSIKLETKGPSCVRLDESDRQKMRNNASLRLVSAVMVYEFLRDTIVDQNLEQIVNKDEIGLFLTTKDDEERTKLGNQLLDAATMMATENIRPMYLAAYKKRLITPEMPAEPRELIIDQPFLLGTPKRKRKARLALRKRLARQYDFELADVI